MASVQECFVKIKQFLGQEGVVDDQKILDTLNELNQKRAELGDEKFLSVINETRKALEERNAALEKQKAVTVQRYVERKAQMNKIISQGGTASDGVASVFSGLTKRFEDSQTNVGGVLSNYRAQYHGAIEFSVIKNDAQALVKTEEFSLALRKEMDAIGKGLEPGASGNPIAGEVAKTMRSVYNKMRSDLVRAGYTLGELKNYMGWQHWDKTKLSKIGVDEWTKDFVQHLDGKLSLEPGEDIVKRAEQAYNSVVNGQSSSYLQSRSLHFKNGEAVHMMLSKYGTFPNAVESIFQQADSVARRVALAEFLGPDIKKGAELLDKLAESKGGFGTAAERDFNTATKYVEYFSGALAGHNDFARLSAGWRSFQQSIKLGGAVITAGLGDIFSGSANFRSQVGGSALDASAAIWKNYARLLTNKEAQLEVASEMHTFANALASEFHLENGGIFPGAAPGNMARFASKMFQWTGLERHNNAYKSAIVASAGARLAGYVGKTLDELPGNVGKTLKSYGINETEWKALSKAVVEMPWGDKVLSPAKAMELSGVDGIKLSNKLGSFMNDIASQTVLDSDAYVKGLGHQGTKGGTVVGELMRMFFQFKGAPIQQSRNLSRIYHTYGGGLQGGTAVAQAMAMYTLAGYTIYSAKEIMNNKTPPSPTKPDTWWESAQRGGAAGVFSDYLLAEYDKNYRNLALDLMGPTMGDIGKAGHIVYQALKNPKAGTAKDALQFGVQHIPGNNMWMVQPIVHGLFLQSMYDTIKPGTYARETAKLRGKGQDRLIDIRR